MAKKHKTFPRVKEILEASKKDFEDITMNEKKIKENKTHRDLIELIVDSVENKRRLDHKAYNELISSHPQIKSIVDALIHQVQLFSIYDNEPNRVNFNYEAYLIQIDMLVNL
jgi:hypothetical protein